jgi:integrase
MALYRRSPGGPWWTRFAVRGRVVKRSTFTRDRKSAEEFEVALKARFWRQAQLGESAHTWREAVARLKRESTWRPSTATRNAYALKYFEALNPIPIAAITVEVTRAARDRVEKDQSPASANRIMATMTTVLHAAVRWGWLTHAPKVPMVHIPDRDPVWITPEQCTTLMQELPRHLRGPVLFSVLTGIRMANVRDLTWDRVDLERAHVWVPSSSYKTKRAQGFALAPEVVQLLETLPHRTGRVFLYPAPMKGFKETGAVDMRPIAGTFNTKAFRKALKRAGIACRWHDLRHSFASWLALAGASDSVLRAAGGWTSPKMVARYAHLRSDDLRPWVSAVGTKAGTALSIAIEPEEKKCSEIMVPEEGLEPPTRALRMRCSTS